MRCLVRLLGPILVAAGLLAAPGRAAPPERTIVIGTAPVAGIYFPAGGALCNLVNRQRERHGLHCLVESTAGSADNLERLRRGELDFALVQSDWQYLAGTTSRPATRNRPRSCARSFPCTANRSRWSPGATRASPRSTI